MTNSNFNKGKQETLKVLKSKRQDITESYGLGLLTWFEYSTQLDHNLRLQTSTINS